MTAAKKKTVYKTEQKPRMNLIPNSVRQQMKGPPPPGFPGVSSSKGPPPPGFSDDVEMPPPPVPKKSNDDFRKLLQKWFYWTCIQKAMYTFWEPQCIFWNKYQFISKYMKYVFKNRIELKLNSKKNIILNFDVEFSKI